MVSEFVRKSPTKSCLLDSLPTQIFKECLDILSPSVTEIVNSSFINGVFPNSYKNAIITPLLKKSGLDTNLKNYKPISNLPFISKLIKHIVVNQLQNHLSCHHLKEPFQSAYRQYHSTETALIKIRDDILFSMDAFDTVDHRILLHRLEHTFGLSGQDLS